MKKRIHRSKANSASKKGHIHKHNPTWLPKTRIAKTHAWYRRNKQVPPSRLKKEEPEKKPWIPTKKISV